MGTVERLEQAGEVLSPAIRVAIEALETQLATALARIAELERRLGLNSTNSSLPPSRDLPGVKHAKPPRSGRKRGAQPGHEPHQRALLPPERVDHVVKHWPEQCRHCGHCFSVAREVGEPERRQVLEVPPLRVQVTEHRLVRLCCPVCQRTTKAEAPQGVEAPTSWGSRLVGVAAVLTVRLRASRRNLRRTFADLLDVEPPSTGLLQRWFEETSRALRVPYREVRQALRASPAVGVDETGWTLRGGRAWLWTGVTPRFSFYRLARRRSARERERLLGRTYAGIVTSDRAGAYAALPPEQRQLCWAHPKRDFAAWEAYGGQAARLSRWAVAECGRLFRLRHRRQHGEITPEQCASGLHLLQVRFTRLLYHAHGCGETKVEHMADRLLGHWEALWTFTTHETVEPTNNEAERALRAGVIWRKTSFGSQSERGLRMIERLLTVAQTSRKQDRDLLDYLTSAITAHRLGQTPPPLLFTP